MSFCVSCDTPTALTVHGKCNTCDSDAVINHLEYVRVLMKEGDVLYVPAEDIQPLFKSAEHNVNCRVLALK